MTQYFILTLDSALGPNAAAKLLQDAVREVLQPDEEVSVRNFRRIIAKEGLHAILREVS